MDKEQPRSVILRIDNRRDPRVNGHGSHSALSQLNFRVDRGKFAAGVADLHLPVDAALAGKANIGKFIWDDAIGFAVLALGH